MTAETPPPSAAKPPKCAIRCGIYVCDREPNHGGEHRGYNEEHDEPVFWKGKLDGDR